MAQSGCAVTHHGHRLAAVSSSGPTGHVCRLLGRSANIRKGETCAVGFLFFRPMNATKPAIERVMSRIVRIPIAGCWIFTGALNEAGYGIVGIGGRGAGNDRAHRVTYRHFCGAIPDGLFVCHRCDQPACCNPHHLFLGTNAENMADCRAKGRASDPPRNRHVLGSVHPGSKLTEVDIKTILSMRREGRHQKQIAKEFGVGQSTISRICRGLRWKHVG